MIILYLITKIVAVGFLEKNVISFIHVSVVYSVCMCLGIFVNVYIMYIYGDIHTIITLEDISLFGYFS